MRVAPPRRFFSVLVAKLLYSNGLQDIYLYSLSIVFLIVCVSTFGTLQFAFASACSVALRGLVADGYWILMRNYVVYSLDIQYMYKWCVGVPDIIMCDIVLVQNLVPACFAFASVRLVALRWLVGWLVCCLMGTGF